MTDFNEEIRLMSPFDGAEQQHWQGVGAYLKQEVLIEPLVFRWYAWPHLLSPIQRALNIAYRYQALLQSFLANPASHIEASANPALYGGPFVQLPHESIGPARALLESTARRCAPALELAKSLRLLDTHLQELAQGYSMGELYRALPTPLAGLVEFVYDLHNHPRLRVHEELATDEPALQQSGYELRLSVHDGTERPFFMSTPRLVTDSDINLAVPFADESIDGLTSMRAQPGDPVLALSNLGVEMARIGSLDTWFTTTAPKRGCYDYRGDGVRLRYFGHACVLLQSKHSSVLIDPLLAWGKDPEDGRFTAKDLPDHIDVVVISHNHHDHCNPETLLQLRHRIGRVLIPNNNGGSICDPSMKLILRELGIANVTSMDAFEAVQLADGSIVSLPFPGEHGDLEVYSRHGAYVDLCGHHFAFLADSDGRDPELYRRIRGRLATHLDALFIGMECHGAPMSWLYEPLLTRPISRRDDESRRLSGSDARRAWAVVTAMQPRNVFVYAMGQEPWLQYNMGLRYSEDSIQLKEVKAFLRRCREHGIAAEQLVLKKEWEFLPH